MIALVGRQSLRVGRAALPLVLASGVGDMTANALFLLATQQPGQLAITGVLASLYPVSTVVLAQVVLRERLVGGPVGRAWARRSPPSSSSRCPADCSPFWAGRRVRLRPGHSPADGQDVATSRTSPAIAPSTTRCAPAACTASSSRSSSSTPAAWSPTRRWPAAREGPLERPDLLFAAAREAGRLAELDEVCRAAAFRGAVDARAAGAADRLRQRRARGPGHRAAGRPARHRRRRARAGCGWSWRSPSARWPPGRRSCCAPSSGCARSAGASRSTTSAPTSMSLAFMPLLRPDVVKLDLRLVQERPGPAIAADHERGQRLRRAHRRASCSPRASRTSGHLAMARALGATLGQGWLFGRPGPGRRARTGAGELHLPRRRAVGGEPDAVALRLPAGRRAAAAVAEGAADRAEQAARARGDAAGRDLRGRRDLPGGPPLHARPPRQRYRDLVERTGFVCALGEGLPVEPLPGLRGADARARATRCAASGTSSSSARTSAPRCSPATSATTARTSTARFEYALTYDRDTVVRAAHALLSRVAPRAARPVGARPAAVAARAGPPAPSRRLPAASATTRCCDRALAATTSGVTIADCGCPTSRWSTSTPPSSSSPGLSREEVLGRNCRFLQGTDTDRGRRRPHPGGHRRPARSAARRVLNLRGPDRTPWWNEIHLAPVADAAGTVVQYIGVQHDVTARVEAERALLQERDRTRGYLARIEELAYTDPLTGLPNRRRLEEQVETAIWTARAGGDAARPAVRRPRRASRTVNDRLGHAAGDELLQTAAAPPAQPAAPERPAGPARRRRVPGRAGRPGPGHGRGRRPRRLRRGAGRRRVSAPGPARGRAVGVRRERGRRRLPRRTARSSTRCCTAPKMYARKVPWQRDATRVDAVPRPVSAASGGSSAPARRGRGRSAARPARPPARCGPGPPVGGQLHHPDDAVGPRRRGCGRSRPAAASRSAIRAAESLGDLPLGGGDQVGAARPAGVGVGEAVERRLVLDQRDEGGDDGVQPARGRPRARGRARRAAGAPARRRRCARRTASTSSSLSLK